MKKINKKSINYGLKVLTILAFVLILMPFKVSAQPVGNNNGGPEVPLGGGGYGNYYIPYQTPIYVAPTPVIHSSSTNPNPVMTVNYTPKKTVAVAKPKTVSSPNTGNALAANAVYGSNGFLPSGIIQWILSAIAILIIVILGRTVFGAKNNYHSTPLKHE